MPPKIEHSDLSYSEALKDLQKLASSLQKSLTKVTKSLEDVPEETKKQSREERKRDEYEKCKKRYKFSDREKNELLDSLVDTFNLENISTGGMGDYEIGEFIDDNVPDFQEKARVLMEKCRSDLEKLLPPTVASKNSQDLSR